LLIVGISANVRCTLSFLTLSGKKFGGIYETAALVSQLQKPVPRTPSAEFPDKITVAGEKVLEAEDIINFTPEAIHQVQAIGEEPVICF
jgi:hypothetical protein